MAPPIAAGEPAPAHRGDLDAAAKRSIIDLYDGLAPRRAKLRQGNWYYNRELARYFQFLIPPGKRVLEVGCGDGWLLKQLAPSRGMGIDFSPGMIAVARQANADAAGLEFCVADIERTIFGETFDFIVLSDLLGGLLDIEAALDNLRSACHEETRLVINYHSILWEPAFRLAARLGLKTPQPHQNWLSPSDIDDFVTLCDFELVRRERRLLLPKFVPLLARLVNGYLGQLPGINRLCMAHFLVLRPRPRPQMRQYSTSIVIPCRNEKGNIRGAVQRMPDFGAGQEFIFVDGHSTDGTIEEIEKVIADFPGKNIKLLRQEGKGKGDAVRLGFANASNDILMILDADLTVPPEDLAKFYCALARGKGEFINGSRLVYPMEHEAMRALNMLGNKFFSWALSYLMSQRLKDTLCGTKVLSMRHYQQIAAGRSFFGDFDPFGDFDLLFGAAKLNLKIAEIPVRYRERRYGRTNISRFRHGYLLLRMTAFAFRKLKRL